MYICIYVNMHACIKCEIISVPDVIKILSQIRRFKHKIQLKFPISFFCYILQHSMSRHLYFPTFYITSRLPT